MSDTERPAPGSLADPMEECRGSLVGGFQSGVTHNLTHARTVLPAVCKWTIGGKNGSRGMD